MDELKNIDEFNEVLEKHHEYFLLFKYSNSCAVSMRVYREVEKGLSEKIIQIPIYLVVVQMSRELSDHISQIFVIEHESPQVILYKKNVPIITLNHHEINSDIIAASIKEYNE